MRPALGAVDQGEGAEGLAAGDQRKRGDGGAAAAAPAPRGASSLATMPRPALGVKSRDDHRPAARAAAVGTGARRRVRAPPAGRRSGASPRPCAGSLWARPTSRRRAVGVEDADQAPVGQQRDDEVGEPVDRLVGVEGRGHGQVDVAEQHHVPAGRPRPRRPRAAAAAAASSRAATAAARSSSVAAALGDVVVGDHQPAVGAEGVGPEPDLAAGRTRPRSWPVRRCRRPGGSSARTGCRAPRGTRPRCPADQRVDGAAEHARAGRVDVAEPPVRRRGRTAAGPCPRRPAEQVAGRRARAPSRVMAPTLPHRPRAPVASRASRGHPLHSADARARATSLAAAPGASTESRGSPAGGAHRDAGALQQRGRRARAADAGGTAVDDGPARATAAAGLPCPGSGRRGRTLVPASWRPCRPPSTCSTALAVPLRQRRGRAAAGPRPRGRRRHVALGGVPRPRQRLRGELPAAVATGRPVTFERRTPAPLDGWFEVRAWPGPDGLAVYFLDVTERRRRRGAARRGRARGGPAGRVSAELAGALDTESALGPAGPARRPDAGRRLHRHRRRPRRPRARRRLLARRPGARGRCMERYAARPPRRPAQRLPGRPGAATPATPLTERSTPSCDLLPPGPAARPADALGPASAVVLPLTAAGPHGRRPHPLPRRRPRPSAPRTSRPRARSPPQAGLAVARVHRQSQQAQLAEALQRSLLTEPPDPATPRSRCGTCPAAEAARVGGDWYDAFLQRDGAAGAGDRRRRRARHRRPRRRWASCAACCAASPTTAAPGRPRCCAAWTRPWPTLQTDTLATAAVARFEQTPASRRGRRRRLRWANAGHLPPLVVTPTARSPCSAARRRPDARRGPARRAPRVGGRRSTAGATVLLYTDGLSSGAAPPRRGHGPAARPARRAGRPALEELCDELLERLVQGTPAGRRRAGRRPSGRPRTRRGEDSGLPHG